MAVLFSRDDLNRVGTMLDGVRSIGEALMAAEKTIAMAQTISGNLGGFFFEDAWVTQAKKDIAGYIGVLQRDLQQLHGERTAAVPASWSETIRGDIMMLWTYAQLVQGEFPPESQALLVRVQNAILQAVDDLEFGLEQAPGLIVDAAKGAAGVVGDVAGAAAGLVGNTASSLLGPIKWYLIGAGALLVGGTVIYLLVAGGAARKVAAGAAAGAA